MKPQLGGLAPTAGAEAGSCSPRLHLAWSEASSPLWSTRSALAVRPALPFACGERHRLVGEAPWTRSDDRGQGGTKDDGQHPALDD